MMEEIHLVATETITRVVLVIVRYHGVVMVIEIRSSYHLDRKVLQSNAMMEEIRYSVMGIIVQLVVGAAKYQDAEMVI